MPKRSVPEGPGRRIALLSRTTPDLRLHLETAASISGRSLGQEVEARLEQSFSAENLLVQIFGNPDRSRRVIALSAGMEAAERDGGSDPEGDGDAMVLRDLLVIAAAKALIEAYEGEALQRAAWAEPYVLQGIQTRAKQLAEAAMLKGDRNAFRTIYPGDLPEHDPRADEYAAHDGPKRRKRTVKAKA